jgi:hypothetical protein
MFFGEDLCVPERFFFERGHAPLTAAHGKGARAIAERSLGRAWRKPRNCGRHTPPGTSAR